MQSFQGGGVGRTSENRLADGAGPGSVAADLRPGIARAGASF